jgi:hypothetical protein
MEMAALSIGIEIADEFLLHSPNTTHIAFFADNAAVTTAKTKDRAAPRQQIPQHS